MNDANAKLAKPKLQNHDYFNSFTTTETVSFGFESYRTAALKNLLPQPADT